MKKYAAKTDVAVLMLFFTRSETFQQVFNEVRKARPSRLFLFQDGPRGERDMAGIEACRKIVADEEIDWECEVHRNYQEQNLGCMVAGFTSHRWAFSLADRCMVLEDDVVPSQSFFPFCKEMLDRYADDERITMVAGFNVDEVTEGVPYDYFFTSAFSIWGWASWRRVVSQWDEKYGFLDDAFLMKQLDALIRQEVDLFDSRDDIQLDYFGLADAFVEAPRPQLTRVVVNLITNAIQAVDGIEGKKRLVVSLRNAVEDGFYDIVVEDNGPGVDAANQDKIFTPDFTTKTSGSGLGLAICRRIVEHCGGSVSYSKSFNLGGACFTVKYPKA